MRWRIALFGGPAADSSCPRPAGSSGQPACPSIDLETAVGNAMTSSTTAGRGCEALYQNSGGGRVTDSPPPRGEPAQTHDYSAHARWDHDSVRSAAKRRECSFQSTALDDPSIPFESGTIPQEGSRSFERASLRAASPVVNVWSPRLRVSRRAIGHHNRLGPPLRRRTSPYLHLQALRDDQ